MPEIDLLPDCGSCAAVCCIATSFERSEDFAITKPAGRACPHLGADRRCTIHSALNERGFSGCAVFGCYGAGPRVTRSFAESEWIEAFSTLREVHELIWLLSEAAKLCSGTALIAELEQQSAALAAIDGRSPLSERHRKTTRALLLRTGEALGGRRSRLPILAR